MMSPGNRNLDNNCHKVLFFWHALSSRGVSPCATFMVHSSGTARAPKTPWWYACLLGQAGCQSLRIACAPHQVLPLRSHHLCVRELHPGAKPGGLGKCS